MCWERDWLVRVGSLVILFFFFLLVASFFYITNSPWIGHGNASRVFDSYLATVGHGAVLNMNIPPDRTGTMNASVAQVMVDVGKAINKTFGVSVGEKRDPVSSRCIPSVLVLDHLQGVPFDYVVTMEDLKQGGQRIANYSVDYRAVGSSEWETLVPVIVKHHPHPPLSFSQDDGNQVLWRVGDRPDGHDPRDQYVGHKRIDVPMVNTSDIKIDAVRFNCWRALEEPIYIRSFSLHKRDVPWEKGV